MVHQDKPFALILAIWGTRYGARHINEIVRSAFRLSPRLAQVVVLTDRTRKGIDHRAVQQRFPEPFCQPEFFGHGYRAKLAVFSAVAPDPGLPCVFLDLDTVVVGDLGRIADLVSGPDDLFMLPPAGLGFGTLRRLIDRLRGNPLHFPVGNSSVLAFHSAASPNLAWLYAELRDKGRLDGGWASVIDDVLISWFGRGRVRAVPGSCAVMLRREFLSRIPFWPRMKARLPWVHRRRQKIAAVTMNGISLKAETLATLDDGAVLGDGRGRRGTWSADTFGSLWITVNASVRRIASAAGDNESD